MEVVPSGIYIALMGRSTLTFVPCSDRITGQRICLSSFSAVLVELNCEDSAGNRLGHPAALLPRKSSPEKQHAGTGQRGYTRQISILEPKQTQGEGPSIQLEAIEGD